MFLKLVSSADPRKEIIVFQSKVQECKSPIKKFDPTVFTKVINIGSLSNDSGYYLVFLKDISASTLEAFHQTLFPTNVDKRYFESISKGLIKGVGIIYVPPVDQRNMFKFNFSISSLFNKLLFWKQVPYEDCNGIVTSLVTYRSSNFVIDNKTTIELLQFLTLHLSTFFNSRDSLNAIRLYEFHNFLLNISGHNSYEFLDFVSMKFQTDELSLGSIHVLDLGVRMEFRNLGIATYLLKYCFYKCKTLSRYFIYLCVACYDHAAIKLYEKAGFVKVIELDGYYIIRNQKYSAYLYIKIVNPSGLIERLAQIYSDLYLLYKSFNKY